MSHSRATSRETYVMMTELRPTPNPSAKRVGSPNRVWHLLNPGPLPRLPKKDLLARVPTLPINHRSLQRRTLKTLLRPSRHPMTIRTAVYRRPAGIPRHLRTTQGRTLISHSRTTSRETCVMMTVFRPTPDPSATRVGSPNRVWHLPNPGPLPRLPKKDLLTRVPTLPINHRSLQRRLTLKTLLRPVRHPMTIRTAVYRKPAGISKVTA